MSFFPGGLSKIGELLINNSLSVQGSKLRPIRSYLRLNFSYLRLEKRE